MVFKKDISLVFNYIKTSNENKVLFPKNIKYYKLKSILHILVKYGIIYSFGVISNRLYVQRNKHITHGICCVNGVKYFSNYKLRSVISKHPANVYIVSTTLGVLDSKAVVKLGVGGYIVFIIKPKYSIFL